MTPVKSTSENPTAHTSSAPAPHTPVRAAVVGLAESVQAEPSQCRIVPCPTAQTSRAPLPHTATSGCIEPPAAGVADHLEPSQCRIKPKSPTTQTSLGPLPHTPDNAVGDPLPSLSVQPAPLQRRTLFAGLN